ncbi:MAG: hypothetical protein EOP49_30110 [Sphingobacteriales bacterium]|nr:MAG: hypothetical protein EOP49_30110 [Sphingobacteriales bacterium]
MHYLLTILLLLLSLQSSAQMRTYVVPVLHGLHRTNDAYNYDSLRTLIGKLQPDLILVEMRSEDMEADTAYLKQNYPYEMWMVRYWFPETRLAGFDWLGEELEGRPVPAGYWKDSSSIKKLQRQLTGDSAIAKLKKPCDAIQEMRKETLRTGSLKSIINRDPHFVVAYYDCLIEAYVGTDYQPLHRFYEKRNKRLTSNIRDLLKNNRAKRILILTGADHYPYIYKGLLAAGYRLDPV